MKGRTTPIPPLHHVDHFNAFAMARSRIRTSNLLTVRRTLGPLGRRMGYQDPMETLNTAYLKNNNKLMNFFSLYSYMYMLFIYQVRTVAGPPHANSVINHS